MSGLENLFDEDELLPNIKGAAYFILLYEHFEDIVISTVKEFFSYPCILDGVMYKNIDNRYINTLKDKIKNEVGDSPIPRERLLRQALRDREQYEKAVLSPIKGKCSDAKKLRGSLNWLSYNGVFTTSEIDRIMTIRSRRNDVVHELFKVLAEGLTESDAKMIADLLEFHGRVNNWRFQQIDMPVMGIELPEGAAPEDVMGGDDVALMGIFRILFYGEGEFFKEELKKAKKQDVSKSRRTKAES